MEHEEHVYPGRMMDGPAEQIAVAQRSVSVCFISLHDCPCHLRKHENARCFVYFFFLIIRRPQRSPLFPYPPFFRSPRYPELLKVRRAMLTRGRAPVGALEGDSGI